MLNPTLCGIKPAKWNFTIATHTFFTDFPPYAYKNMYLRVSTKKPDISA